jgi:GTP-binding protein Era
VLKQKVSIVTPKAQTTRNNIKGIYTTDSCQVIFTDTPGITSTDFGKLLNAWMNRYSFSAAGDADLVLFFVDVSEQHPEKGIGEEEAHILSKLKENQNVILVANKVDAVKQMRADDTLAVYKKAFPFKDAKIISAEKGTGMEELLQTIISGLPEGPQYFPEDYISDTAEEFLIAEIIREKIFMNLRQELPYNTTVTVEDLKDHSSKDMLLVQATIHVAKESQKGMIIGKKGMMLNKIGKTAREELEKIYETKIGLKLFVRVEKNWNEKEKLLLKVGFKKEFEQ